MAEEVKVVQSVEAPKEEVVKVETPKTVSVEEYETLKNKLVELESSFKEKVNQASKSEREKMEKQLAKLKLSTEEQIKVEQEEKLNAILAENNALKTEKKQTIIRSNLVENGLPPILANDVRLVNAEIDDVSKVIKDLKKEYAEYIKETNKPAVVGTAPKTQQTTTTNGVSNTIDRVVANNPILAQYLKGNQK
jgi:Skp family chaperone for outer membrane proteins